MGKYSSIVYEDCDQDADTVLIPRQPLKGFRRDLDVDFDGKEINGERVKRELKSLQERLSAYYSMGREEREKHRLNLLQNLNQLDLYWFESEDFEKSMFRFRSAWTTHLVDESIEQLYRALSGNLKDLWSLEYEIGIMDVKTTDPMNLGRDDVDSMSEFVIHALLLLKMELDKLETQTAKKREAHRRLLLEDLKIIRGNLLKSNAHNNAVNFLIDHFNRKVFHSLRTSHEYCMQSVNEFQNLQSNIEYICEELMNRLILDNSMPEYEKALLGNELNNFRKDAKAHIEEVDNLHYELREMVRGINLKKIRGLTKDEYKERVHAIIAFLEKAEVPLHVFKSVGFDLKKTEELSALSVHKEPVRTGVEETDYESD